jgi:hypothetical protein
MKLVKQREDVTLQHLQKAIPSRKGSITQETVDLINKVRSEPEFQGEDLITTLITYEGAMVGAKASIGEYLTAVRFCAYMMTNGENYTEAYKRAFWDREFVQNRLNTPSGSAEYAELTSAASRYRRSKLVVDILTLSQVPLDLMFTGVRYKALGVLADRMENAKLDKDKIAAADTLLKHTAPKDNKLELNIGIGNTDAITSLNDQLAALAKRQQSLLSSGLSLQEVQRLGVKLSSNEDAIDVEYSDA